MLVCILWCVMGGLSVAVLDVVWPIDDHDKFGRSLFAGVAWPVTIGFLIAYATYSVGQKAVHYVSQWVDRVCGA